MLNLGTKRKIGTCNKSGVRTNQKTNHEEIVPLFQKMSTKLVWLELMRNNGKQIVTAFHINPLKGRGSRNGTKKKKYKTC